MQKKNIEINLFFYTFIILFLIIWKTNSYIINDFEEAFLNSLINKDILISRDNFIFQGNEEDRKYFRRFNLFFFSYLYEKLIDFVININIKNIFIIYFHYSIISFALTGGIFFTLKCVQQVSKDNIFIIWIYILSIVSYILVVGKVNDGFSHFEFFLLSGCLLFSMKKKILLFILFSFFAIINRETGILACIIYFLLNEKNLKNLVISFIPIIFFVLLNIDFFTNYEFSYSKIILVSSDASRVNLINIFSLELKKFFGYLIYTLIIYCPIIFCLKNYKVFTNRNYNYLFFLFLFILNLGTFVGNIYPQLVIIPFLSIIFFGKKIKKINE